MKQKSRVLPVLLSLSMIASSLMPMGTFAAPVDEPMETIDVSEAEAASTASGDAAKAEEPKVVKKAEEADDEIACESGSEYVTLIFNANGGHFSEDLEDTIRQNVGNPGEMTYLFNQNDIVSADGEHILSGWSDAADGNVKYKPGSAYTFKNQDETLFAIWEEAYKITVYPGEGESFASSDPLKGNRSYGDALQWISAQAKEGNDNAYQKIEYLAKPGTVLQFETSPNADKNKLLTGWKEDEQGNDILKWSRINFTPISSNLTLYANWTDAYQVTLHATEGNRLTNGFWNNWNNSGVVYAYSRDELLDATTQEYYSTYYTFLATQNCEFSFISPAYVKISDSSKALLGWSPSQNGQTVYSSNYTYTVAANTEFWMVTGEGDKLTFHPNGGKIDGKTEIVVKPVAHNTEFSIDEICKAEWIDDTKEFIGWSTTANTDKPSFVGWTRIEQDETYYAVYADKAKVTIKAGNGYLGYPGEEPLRELQLDCVKGPEGIQLSYESPSYTIQIHKGSSSYNYGIRFYPPEEGMIPGGFTVSSPDGECSKNVDITGNMTLYVKWVEGYKVTLDYNGGTENQNYSISYYNEDIYKALHPAGTFFSDINLIGDDFWRDRINEPDGKLFVGWTTRKNDRTTLLHFKGDTDVSEELTTLTKDTTLYAFYVDVSKVTFNANGGYFGDNSEQTTLSKDAEKGTTFDQYGVGNPNIDNDDLVFGGWSLTQNGAAIDLCDEEVDGQDVILYAIWLPAVTLTVKANGFGYIPVWDYVQDIETECATREFKVVAGHRIGTNASITDPVSYNESLHLFNGWYLYREADGANAVSINSEPLNSYEVEEYPISENMIAVADWTDAVTVTFDANGKSGFLRDEEVNGTEMPVWRQTDIRYVKKGSIIDYIGYAVPEDKDGKYVFAGWSLTKNGEAIDWDTQITQSVTLYARWVDAISITFDTNGIGGFSEEYSDENGDLVDRYKSTYKTVVRKGIDYESLDYTHPEDPNNVYIFKGWSLSKTANQELYWDTNFNTDVTLYAIWKQAVTIKLNANGNGQWYVKKSGKKGYYDSIVIKAAIGENLGEFLSSGTVRRMKNADTEHYQLAGWSTSANGSVLDADHMKISGDMELFAIWKPTVSVTHYPNEGGFFSYYSHNLYRDYVYGEAGNQTDGSVCDRYYSDASIQAISYENWYPDKENAGFAGWSTVSGNEAACVNESTYKMGDSEQLYAVWSSDYLTVDLDLGKYVKRIMNPHSEWHPEPTVSANDPDIDSYEYNPETNEYGWWSYSEYREFATEEEQHRAIRLAKNNTSVINMILHGFWDNGSFMTSTSTDINAPLCKLKGFSKQKTGGMLIDVDSYRPTGNDTLYAIYETPEANTAAQIDNATEVTFTKQETTQKATTLVEAAVQTPVKKTLQDIIVPADSNVMVQKIEEVKDEKVIDTLKDVLVSVMDTAKDEQATVEAVHLFDLNASGSGKVSIYVGKAYKGQMAVIGHFHNGMWTTQQCRVDKNGYVTPSFGSFSPVAVSILTTSNALDTLPTEYETVTKPVTPTKPTKSAATTTSKTTTAPPAKTETRTAAKTDISSLTITLSKEAFTYNGKEQKPSVSVKTPDGKTLTAGTDYDVSVKGAKDVGEYSAAVTGKGNYTGSKTVTWQIVPKNAGSLKLKATGTKLKVSWKKQLKQTSGYEVQYADNKNFKKARTVKIKKNKTASTVIKKGIKKGKTYFVRIRSFKSAGGKKIYSDWSKTKKIKIKKK